MIPTEVPPTTAGFALTAHGLGRRFGRQWVFRDLTFDFRAGEPTAILGPNGAGKSTLLSVLAGWAPATKGTTTYFLNGQTLNADDLYRYTALAAPYLDLPDELTVAEAAAFQAQLKPWRPEVVGSADVLAQARLDGPLAHRHVRDLSSGMRQRLRLAFALFSSAQLVVLDEPTANLDRTGIGWYHEIIARTCTPERLVLVASNVPEEYSFCSRALNLADFASPRGR
ncbi:MAG: ATP-binding cassette domain-containing protein [Hymenobacteraceae bacterium]|nr:ATP-binding cassette domain-containing protein [Hymenobacteraceae bacterium]